MTLLETVAPAAAEPADIWSHIFVFVLAFTKDKSFQLDFSDDIQQGALITHDGEVKHARTRDALQKGAA